MKIDYNSGGVFNIKQVKWSLDGQMFLDYYILIESIKNPMHFDVLSHLHERSALLHDLQIRNKVVIDRNKIKHLLTGVGRIVQYFNPMDDSKIDLNDEK